MRDRRGSALGPHLPRASGLLFRCCCNRAAPGREPGLGGREPGFRVENRGSGSEPAPRHPGSPRPIAASAPAAPAGPAPLPRRSTARAARGAPVTPGTPPLKPPRPAPSPHRRDVTRAPRDVSAGGLTQVSLRSSASGRAGLGGGPAHRRGSGCRCPPDAAVAAVAAVPAVPALRERLGPGPPTAARAPARAVTQSAPAALGLPGSTGETRQERREALRGLRLPACPARERQHQLQHQACSAKREPWELQLPPGCSATTGGGGRREEGRKRYSELPPCLEGGEEKEDKKLWPTTPSMPGEWLPYG